MEKTGTAAVMGVAIVFTLSCLFLLLSSSMPAPALAQDEELKPDLTITAIKPYHYEWCEECDPPCPKGDPWFTLKNYVDVTVMNNGENKTNRSFVVTLYADDDEIGRETVEELLEPEDTTDVKFEWTPEPEEEGDPLSWTDTSEGAKLTHTDTSKTYTLKAVVDESDEISEGDEENNELTKEQEVIWNGYTADQPLENYVHDEVEGGIIYTTGDGQYRGRFTDGTEYGTYYDVNYDDLEIPGNVKLARLYIYHTWSKPDHTAPKIGVTLKTPSDSVHDLSMEKSYNDIKGDFGAWWYVWGTYAYDITEYVGESGTYVVTVTNLNDGSDDDFATEYAFAAPAILVVYEDTTAPKREYWINEGADILLGGRRGDGGFLSLEECKNSATFDGEHLDLEVEKAILGVVSPWGEDVKNVLYFNDEELGEGVYCGYHDSCSKEEEGISMIIGASEAQVGIAVFDVTGDLEKRDNKVIQGDDGDNMMPVNAFLMITYEDEEGEEDEEEEEGGALGPPNITAWNPLEAIVNNTEGDSRTFNISVNQTVDISWQINGTEVQTNESVAKAAYTNASVAVGIWNVSVIATNTTTELSDIYAWIWKVTPALTTATSTSTENITTAPTPTATSTSTVNVTPTPTPALTPASKSEEKKKTGAETPVPGFELPISLFMLIAVAYLIRKRRI